MFLSIFASYGRHERGKASSIRAANILDTSSNTHDKSREARAGSQSRRRGSTNPQLQIEKASNVEWKTPHIRTSSPTNSMDQKDTSSPSTDMDGDGAVEAATAKIDAQGSETPPDAKMRNTVGCQEEDGAPATGRRPIHEEGHPEEKKDDCGDSSMSKYPETSVDKQLPAADSDDNDGVPTGMADDSDEPHVETVARQEFTVLHENNNNSVDFDAPIETDDRSVHDQLVATETEFATADADMDAEEEPQSRQEEPEPAEASNADSEIVSSASHIPPPASETESVPSTTPKTGANEDDGVPGIPRQKFTVRHENNNSVDFDAPIRTDDLDDSDKQVAATETELATAAKDMGAEDERQSRQQKNEPPAEVIENVSTPPPQEDVTETSSPGSRTPPSASEAESAPPNAAKDSEEEKRQSPAEVVGKISALPNREDATDTSSAASRTPPPVTSQQQPTEEFSREERHPLRDMNELPLRTSKIMYASSNIGRRSIHLRLLEERLPEQTSKKSSPPPRSLKAPFKDSLRRIRSLSLSSAIQTFPKATSTANRSAPSALEVLDEKAPSHVESADERWVDRGTISVSWYEGTTSSEMTDHVFNCVLRKLYQCDDHKNQGKLRLKGVRLLDENVTPHGEVVLCPFLPDGSQFLLKFRVKYDRPVTPPPQRDPYFVYANKPPDSPSAEPSPHPSHANLQSLQQMQVLNAAAAILQQQHMGGGAGVGRPTVQSQGVLGLANAGGGMPALPVMPPPVRRSISKAALEGDSATSEVRETSSTATTPLRPLRRSSQETRFPRTTDEMPDENLTTDQLIEKQLRQLNNLFQQRQSSGASDPYTKESESDAPNPERDAYMAKYRREEKKQIMFVVANYLVMFFAVIALSAEIQSRLPQWMDWVQKNYDNVQNCATDKDALIECLAAGDFSGLVASFLLWATQSASAKRIFLFGFDTPKKLWTVVYEAGITSVCWGISYLFIRRGLNPNTRQNFLHKFWKDAVYGSLAGFNAAFLKAVLKNLISEDEALQALEGRQLKIFSWMSALMADE